MAIRSTRAVHSWITSMIFPVARSSSKNGRITARSAIRMGRRHFPRILRRSCRFWWSDRLAGWDSHPLEITSFHGALAFCDTPVADAGRTLTRNVANMSARENLLFHGNLKLCLDGQMTTSRSSQAVLSCGRCQRPFPAILLDALILVILRVLLFLT